MDEKEKLEQAVQKHREFLEYLGMPCGYLDASCAGFREGAKFGAGHLWHDGTEKPPQDVADCAVLLVQLKDNVNADMPAFFCFYDYGEVEPWAVVALGNYRQRFSHDEVKRWMYLDELIERRNQ